MFFTASPECLRESLEWWPSWTGSAGTTSRKATRSSSSARLRFGHSYFVPDEPLKTMHKPNCEQGSWWQAQNQPQNVPVKLGQNSNLSIKIRHLLHQITICSQKIYNILRTVQRTILRTILWILWTQVLLKQQNSYLVHTILRTVLRTVCNLS